MKSEWPPPPPPDETEQQRTLRLEAEQEAKRVSDAIDATISLDRQRSKPLTKLLLLGQSESGKSTILKNIQLHYAPKAFRSEAELWRPVIQLNLIRSVNFILSALDAQSGNSRPTSSTTSKRLSDDLRRLCISLTPLKQVEATLISLVSGFIPPELPLTDIPVRLIPAPVHVRSRGWKERLHLRKTSDTANAARAAQTRQSMQVVNACAEDMQALWNNPEVHDLLKELNITLEDQPGFFLDDIARITAMEYIPCSEDILRARVQTVGPEEHHIHMEPENSPAGKEWIVYDVGGSRGQRAVWAQFFDDVTGIIFMAPASCFNQTLAEDPSTNRMADTMKLWQSICSNKLLQGVDLILFLNKMDILDIQLKSGIQFSRYVTSYKDRPNDTQSVAKYLIEVFKRIHHQHCPRPKRQVSFHMTCATDTKATSVVISQVQDAILIKTLQQTSIV